MIKQQLVVKIKRNILTRKNLEVILGFIKIIVSNVNNA